MPEKQTRITWTAVQMVTAELRFECIKRGFQIDECLITEFFSSYIANLVKQVRSTSSDIKMVDKELHTIQA